MKKRVLAALLLLLLNFFFLTAFLIQRQQGKFSQVHIIQSAVPEGAVTELVLSGNDAVSYSFQPSMHTVDNLILKFSGCLDLEEGWLQVEIHRNDITYYLYEIPVYAFETDEFYLHTGKIADLEKDTSYDISIAVQDLAQQELTLYLADGGHLKSTDDSITPFWGYEGKLGTHTAAMKIHLFLWAAVDCLGVAILLFFNRLFTEERRRKLSDLARRLREKWRAARRGLRVCLALVLLVGIVCGIANLQYDDLEDIRTVTFWSHGNASKFTGVPLQDGPVVQQFTSPNGDFLEFILFLDNYSPDDDAHIQVKLEDARGTAYYRWYVPVSALGGEAFCLMGQVNQELPKGETCYLRVSLEEGQSAITVRGLKVEHNPGDFHHSLGDVTVNGQPLEGVKLYFCQSYQASLSYPAIWYAALVAALLLWFLLLWCDAPLLETVLKVVCDLCLVLISYFSIELLSGNLYTIKPPYVLLNCLIITGGYWAIRAIAGKGAYYIAALLTFAAGITDYYVRLFKGTDFLLTEISAFKTAMSVTSNYEFTITPVIFTVVVLYVCLIVMRVCVDLNCKSISRKRSIVKRAAALAGSLAMALLLNWNLDYVPFDYFTASNNFENYGWWCSNAVVLKNSKMEKPENYSDAEIERILLEVEPPEDAAITPQNIIVIMNEALSDLSIMGQLETNQDYLPFIRSLTENTLKGNLHVQTLGGGTCITEYEFLTGNSFHFMPMGSMPYSTSNSVHGEPGMASTLKDQGYYAVAVHPYGPENWNRDQVYEAMGFDEFISIDAFEDAELLRNFVSDKANYQKIIEYYEAFRGENLFIFNVTMQNHGGYEISNGTMDTTITIDNIDSNEAEVYLSLMQKTDESFEYLLSYFSQVEEPTMIVMFGDHLPALSEDFYTSLYGKGSTDQTDVERSLKYVTPYIIWTNYESDFDAVPDTSANYLGRLVLQYAGADLSLYDQFILQQGKDIPAIGKYGIIDWDGNYTVYQDIADSQLEDYQILQYLRVEDGTSKYRDIFRVNP